MIEFGAKLLKILYLFVFCVEIIVHYFSFGFAYNFL